MNYLEKNLRFYIGSVISNTPSFFFINKWRHRNTNRLITPKTDICIEGFQRSGNSFFVHYFCRGNKGIKVAHHSHGASQLIEAIEKNIPSILLIRSPEDSVASLLSWDDKLSPDLAMSSYIRFHRKLLPLKEKLLVIKFEDFISNTDPIIVRINNKFGTSFKTHGLSEERIKQEIVKKEKNWGEELNSPYPNEIRSSINKKNKSKVLDHSKYKSALFFYNSLISSD